MYDSAETKQKSRTSVVLSSFQSLTVLLKFAVHVVCSLTVGYTAAAPRRLGRKKKLPRAKIMSGVGSSFLCETEYLLITFPDTVSWGRGMQGLCTSSLCLLTPALVNGGEVFLGGLQ